jgi:hypothetical protein
MSKSLFQRLGLLAATALTAVTLVACGGDSSAPAKKVATSDLNITIASGTTQEAAIISALTAAPYTFTNNLTVGGVTYQQPVKITVTGTGLADLKYAIEDSSTPKQTGTGDLAFGSCIFKGTPDTTFNPCSLSVALKGKTFTPGTQFSAGAVWRLVNIVSGTTNIPLVISADGQVSIKGTVLGTVTVTDPTGGTGT